MTVCDAVPSEGLRILAESFNYLMALCTVEGENGNIFHLHLFWVTLILLTRWRSCVPLFSSKTKTQTSIHNAFVWNLFLFFFSLLPLISRRQVFSFLTSLDQNYHPISFSTPLLWGFPQFHTLNPALFRGSRWKQTIAARGTDTLHWLTVLDTCLIVLLSEGEVIYFCLYL